LWFLNALSKDYETTISYPVRYVNLPENRFLANDPPPTLELIVEAHGFTLLRNKLNLSFTPIVLDVKRIASYAEVLNNMTYKISTSSLINRISAQISNEISIMEIRPEVLLFVLDSLQSKQVKVKAGINLEFEPQYNLSSEIRISPEYVTVKGPGAVLDTVEIIYTGAKRIDKIKKSVEVTLPLIIPEKITVSPEKVKIFIPVEEFTEKKILVPVLITDKPNDAKIKLFPSEIQVSFMIGLSKYSEITANDFGFSIPYAEINEGKMNVPVQLDKKPGFIKEVKYSPQTIEFFIEKE
jgi:YbbR domain-containing protein